MLYIAFDNILSFEFDNISILVILRVVFDWLDNDQLINR
jgi:hypothetical protein